MPVPSSVLVTPSKAPVTTSVALVTTSVLVTTSKAPVTTSMALVTTRPWNMEPFLGQTFSGDSFELHSPLKDGLDFVGPSTPWSVPRLPQTDSRWPFHRLVPQHV